MKHIDLLTLLETRRVCHPSTLVKVDLELRGRLTIGIKGTPWWKEDANHNEEKLISFVFEGVINGAFDLDLLNDDWDECLESFSIINSLDCEWLAEEMDTVYCSAPLSEPFELFALVNDYLRRHDIQSSPFDFVNAGEFGYLKFFKEITSSNSYLLGCVPPALSGIISAELDRQGVRHNKIPTPLRKNKPLLVHFGSQRFFCDTATAIFED